MNWKIHPGLQNWWGFRRKVLLITTNFWQCIWYVPPGHSAKTAVSHVYTDNSNGFIFLDCDHTQFFCSVYEYEDPSVWHFFQYRGDAGTDKVMSFTGGGCTVCCANTNRESAGNRRQYAAFADGKSSAGKQCSWQT